MTPAKFSPERALDIIAAYGADSRRWPADEREAAMLCAIADPVVAAALAEAKQFDGLLGAWAGDVVPGKPLDAGTLIPAPAVRLGFAGHQRRWAGGAMAAAIAGLLLVSSWQATNAPPVEIAANTPSDVSPVSSATGESQDLADAEAFATVFTPTADEDQLI